VDSAASVLALDYARAVQLIVPSQCCGGDVGLQKVSAQLELSKPAPQTILNSQ
jgi:hypothetical protein